MKQLKQLNQTKAVRILLLLLLDAVMINLASFLALFVRMELNMTAVRESGFLTSVFRYAPLDTICTVAVFWLFRLYNSLWAYAGTVELTRVAAASMAATCLKYVGMELLSVPALKSFPVLCCLFLMALVGVSRLAYRYVRDITQRRSKRGAQKRTMLIGAGDAGATALREFQNSQHSSNQVLCIIDDAAHKRGQLLRGVPIVGGREDILTAAEKYRIQEIILAIPSASARQQKEILAICQKTKCTLRTLPALYQLANGEVSIQKIRNVEIEDLLGRDPVEVDLHGIGRHVGGKVVLVTGGGGSIGSELCRQLASFRPAQLIIFDIYENNAYDIQQELLRVYPELHLTVLIGSVQDKARLDEVFSRYRPDLVYHAAAHKHVPLMEDSPSEAVKNNVFGTLNVARAADRYAASRFLLISTDKAVNPTNVMGATKRICEMIVQMMDRQSRTEYVAVRFGNVLGSNGSVIPLFRKQIAAGGPVTVTDPQVIRYFMTIPEAVSLVLQAGIYAKGGEIFILDMGDPVRIDDLARNMIRLSGFEPDVDIPIVYTGLRPGEKLFEELLLSGEGMRKTENNLIYIEKDQAFDDAALLEKLKRLYAAARSRQDVHGFLAEIVPEYRVPLYA